VTIGQEGLRHLGLVRRCDGRGGGGHRGLSGTAVGQSSTPHRGWDDVAGMEGGQSPINELGVACQIGAGLSMKGPRGSRVV